MTHDLPGPDPAVREMEIDGEVTLYHGRTQTALVLNGTASDVWRLVDGTRTPERVAELLASVYNADLDTVRADVNSALRQLREHGLLRPTP